MQPPATFDVIRNDPEWGEFTQNEQGRLRSQWVQQLMGRFTSGTPEQREEQRQQLISDAYSDAPEWQRPVQVKSLYPSAGEIPGAMWDLATRLFTTPQQYLQASFRQPLDRPVLERIVDPFKHAFEYAIGEPEALEKYPYTLYTDPMLIAGVPALGKAAVKGAVKLPGFIAKQVPTVRKVAGKVGERIRPPGVAKAGEETAEAFNARVMAEEAAKRAERIETIKAMRAGREPISVPIKIAPTPTPRGPYNRAMPKLTPHFEKFEAQKVAEFVARHSDDILSKEILSKGPLSPKTISEIERRIFNRVPIPPVPPPPTGYRSTPPVVETVGGPNLNDPAALAEELLKMGQ